MIAFAPSSADIAGFLGLYLVLPVIIIVGGIRLRRKPRWCLGWLLAFATFYGYLFVEANPATSRKRADVALLIQDLKGRPVPNVTIELKQYPIGGGHPTFPRILNQTLTTDTAGRATIITTSHRRISAKFRAPGFRSASISLDRAWTPTFHTGRFDYTWAVLAKNQKAYRGDSAILTRNFPRERPLTIPLVLPSQNDEDPEIEARINELLPNDGPPMR
jgi:hypothetical protein